MYSLGKIYLLLLKNTSFNTKILVKTDWKHCQKLPEEWLLIALPCYDFMKPLNFLEGVADPVADVGPLIRPLSMDTVWQSTFSYK